MDILAFKAVLIWDTLTFGVYKAYGYFDSSFNIKPTGTAFFQSGPQKKTNTSLLVIVIMHVVLRPSFAGAIASKEEPALETEHKPLFIHMQENFDEACHAKTVNQLLFSATLFCD